MRTLQLIVFACILTALSASGASACSCAARTVEEKFTEADYVFEATIIAATLESRVRIEVGEPDDRIFSSAGPVEILFDPRVDYKGRSADLRRLWTPVSGCSCGIKVRIGWRYLFFVSRDGRAGLCGGSEPFVNWQEWRLLVGQLQDLAGQERDASSKDR